MADKNVTEASQTKGNISRRKFVRISTHVEHGLANHLMGAEVIWENGEVSAVFDLSYRGAAVALPESVELRACGKYHITFDLHGSGKGQAEVEVMWTNEQLVGLYFDHLPPETRSLLDNYLKDKIIGANLSLIDPKFYAKGLDCSHWYQGPNGLQVYLWIDPDKNAPPRVAIESEDFVFFFDKGQFSVGGGTDKDVSESFYGDETENTLRPLKVEKRQVLASVLNILTQLSIHEKELSPLFDKIIKSLNMEQEN